MNQRTKADARPQRAFRRVCLALGTAALITAGAPPGDLPLQEVILRAKEKVLPAVVNIQPVSEVYVEGTRRTVTAIGSGVIYTPRGHILTNYHVAGQATRLICTLANKERVPARLIGGDPYTDLAVIQLDLDRLAGNTLTWASLGDSDAVKTGEFVLAIGSPLALSHSLSFGVVSAKDRYIPESSGPEGELVGSYNTWIQTDAAINPGNSGGPLVNLRGEVIGINARKSRAGENLGFAIPVNVARAVAEDLVAKGKVTRSWVGLQFQPLVEFEAYLTVGGAAPRGVLVSGVEPGSPAEEAGIKAGDVLTHVGGQAVDARFHEEVPAIRTRLAGFAVGSKVPLRLVRGGRDVTVTVTTEELGRPAATEFDCAAWGFTVKALSADVARRMGLAEPDGVLVTTIKPDGPAAKAGLAPGDVVHEVERQAVDDLAAFRAAYDKLTSPKAERVLLKLWRRGAVYFRLLKMETPTTTTAPTTTRAAG